MNKAYGVQVTARGPDGGEPRTVPVLVVAGDEQDALLVVSEAVGAGAEAEVLRELTDAEIREHDLDLEQRGAAKSLAVLKL
ncbi:MAG: hypothetical protein MIN69_07065 [Methylorubrum extorquens]|jgi:hypothetical protein|uniref:Uncharacterized protein n=1 Tax=Methylorubrum extorquens (strain DSM 6343 / CIP 106787 / DM4) TaxID=661410 RepID=A0A2P9HAR1_METED|nr:hypothetical protein [Methylorubrum extorquens]UYW32601.1 hypothetical protein OKB92_00260 [Methylorubrum extorquens]SPK01990.1 conserved protein of unknown function [Methylorubrum extorquens DM4]